MLLQGESGSLEINILRRSDPNTEDYWDANWLESEIKVDIPSFKAFYGTNLRVDDLQRFYENLINLEKFNLKNAIFNTMEEGLYLECIVLNSNNIICQGKSISLEGNILEFKFSTNIHALNKFTSQLKSTLTSFPLIGKNNN